MAFSASELKRLFPKPAYDHDDMVKAFASGVREHGLTTPSRLKFALANMAVESASFKAFAENMNYRQETIMKIFGVGKHSAAVTASEAAKLAKNPEALADRVYGIGNPKKAKEFGHTEPGDGFKYRGRSPIQITGKNAYRASGKRLGKDFVKNPELLEKGDVALEAAIDWMKNRPGLYAAMDSGSDVAVCKKINGGTNGLSERIEWKHKIDRVVSDSDLELRIRRLTGPQKSETEEFEEKSQTALVQQKLKDLGYLPGKVDGVFGTKTRDAVAAFEKDNGLPENGVVDEDFLEALSVGKPKPERDVSMKDLKEGGSTTIALGDALKGASVGVPAVGALVNVIPSVEDAEKVSNVVEKIGVYKETASKVAEIYAWTIDFVQSNFAVIGLAVLGFLAWRLAHKIQNERLRSAKTGENMRI